jgi:hypothetical protein
VKKAWLWAYARDDSTFGGSGPPMVAYRFEESRSGDCVRRHLGSYGGILQVDGYAAYNKLLRKDGGNDGPRLAGCWANSRRRFYEPHAAKDSHVATATVERMAELWKLEAQVRGHPPADLQDEQRRSNGVADPNPRAHRQSMAKRRNRCPDAVELPNLSGRSLLLTVGQYLGDLHRGCAFQVA